VVSVLPLAGLRVLDLACGVAGAYAGKLLGDLGADVGKLAAATAQSDAPAGLLLYVNTGKQPVGLEGERWLEVAATVDVVIEDAAPDQGRVSRDELRSANPSLVVVSVTPFGQWGPHARWRGNDLIAFHSSGFAHGFPALQVDAPDLAPLNAPTYAAELLAGQMVAAAAVHGLLVAQATGRGSHLDVSLQEAVAAANHSQFNSVRIAGAARRVFSDEPANPIVALLPCRDGWVAISPREEHQWTRWLDVMGNPAWSTEPRFANRPNRERHWPELYPLLAEWSRTRSKRALFEAAQDHRVACFPLGTASDLLSSSQLAAREFFTQIEDAQVGTVTLPGRPYRLVSEPPAQSAPARANAGLDVVRPLEGVRVVDLSWVLTGPICTKYLAALGADVIKIESATRADLSPRDAIWEELNLSKRSVTLNLKDSRARDLALELIRHSDVVVENFSTGVMERLGLDYPTLKAANPRIIMASSSALGRSGPDRELVAYGTLIQCFTGWAALSAHPGRPPRSSAGVWTDPLTASFETLLVLAAIWRQRASGAGAYFDLSMAETTICSIPEPILTWSMHRQSVQPRGNRHPVHAPQGCYPSLGDDRWLALSVQSDAQWTALCELMKRPDLGADARLATTAGRRAEHDALDAAISAWSRTRPSAETAARLQAHGIAATPTLEPGDLELDEHLQARGFVSHVTRLDGGTSPTLGIPWLIDRQRPNAFRKPPRLGEDNDFVFRTLLRLSGDEYDRLVADHVIY
jgi:crotonobetainyl-CoA:carnitine CoA-transferase CaiB-like acyl-CoA transferase